MTTILIKKKDTAGAPAAGDLTNAAGGAEIAVNTATKRIYTKDSSGTVVEVGTNPTATTMNGNLTFVPDATYDIGASGATRPRNLFLSGDATIGGSIAATTLDLTNLEVTNIKAKDGTAGMQIADSTGVVSFTANPVMSGGTANGVAYLNGSKVLTTGSALTFDGSIFGVVGAVLATGSVSTVQARRDGGDTFGGGATIGFANTAANRIWLTQLSASNNYDWWYYNGSSANRLMTLDTSGNVGIGTSSPAVKLDFGNTTNGTQIVNLRKNNNSIAGLGVNAEYGVRIAGPSDAAAPVSFGEISISDGTTFSEFMRIDSSGNVGIGTSSPSNILHINKASGGTYLIASNGSGTGAFGVGSSGEVTISAESASNPIRFLTNSGATERMRIDSSGNVGIGTSSPTQKLTLSNGTFHINGTSTFVSNVEIGRVGGDNNMGFATGGTERMRITSTGNVGIGTSSPSQNLSVVSSGATEVRSETTATDGSALFSLKNDNAIPWLLTTRGDTNDSFLIRRNGINLVAVDTSGNLGLGVTPSAWASNWKAFQIGNRSLAQTGSGAGDWTMAFNAVFDSTDSRWEYQYTGDSAVRYSQTGAGIHAWYTAPSGTAGNAISFTQAMTLTAGGSLGVGETSPAYRVSVRGTAGSTGHTECLIQVGTDADVYSAQAQIRLAGKYGDAGYAYIAGLRPSGGTATDNALVFGTVATERARIQSNGSFLIGGTSIPAGYTATRFYVEQTTADYSGAFNSTSSTAAYNYGLLVKYSSASPNNTANDFLVCQDSTAVRCEIRSNGGIANYSANDVNLSDRREKTNFAPAKSYLETICAIPVQTFNYADQNLEEDAGLTLGVVAQDVQAVAPELVMESNWAAKDEEPKMRLSIYQTDLQYALMKALQELKAEFDAYKASHP